VAFMLFSDSVFGLAQLKKLNIGDIVSWSELESYNNIKLPIKNKVFGVVSSLFIAERGDRKVALAKVVPLNNSSVEKEILVISLEIVTKTKESLVF
jgi:hypothetical protein